MSSKTFQHHAGHRTPISRPVLAHSVAASNLTAHHGAPLPVSSWCTAPMVCTAPAQGRPPLAFKTTPGERLSPGAGSGNRTLGGLCACRSPWPGRVWPVKNGRNRATRAGPQLRGEAGDQHSDPFGKEKCRSCCLCKAPNKKPTVAGRSQGFWSPGGQVQTLPLPVCTSRSCCLCKMALTYITGRLPGHTARVPTSSWSQNPASVETVLFGKFNGMRQCLLWNVK